MKLEIKQFTLEKPEILTSDYIDNFFASKNYSPLRWAVNKIIDNKLIIDAVVIT